MTLSELITSARSLFNQTDASNSQITDSQITGWANEAYRYILTKMKDIPKKENDLTAATDDITVSSNTLTIDEAYILNPDTSKYKQLSVIDISFLHNIDNGWLTEDTGEPEYFVRKDTFSYYLYPQPDTDWVGQTIKTFGMEFPTAMSDTTDSPDKIPINMQQAIPHYIAYKAFSQLNQSDRAANEITFFRSLVKSMLEISTSGSQSTRTFRFTERID